MQTLSLQVAKMETPVVVISRDIVKPWSETPDHLKRLKLSYLDQLAPPTYSPLLFFIQSNQTNGLTTSTHPQISQRLKHSLSRTLPSFYPFAGRFQDHSAAVDCNDEGVNFVQARTGARLAEAIQDPNVGHLKQYLPMDPTTHHPESLLLVQITFFDCGGLAVGICFWHQIADCTSVMAFINSWAATCRGDVISTLSFNLATYFPAKDIPMARLSESPSSDGKFATKRFVFDKERLVILKQAAASVVKNPTRVEVVSAFIWRCFLKAAKIKNPKAETNSAAFHVVNLRPRKKILENTFGNCTFFSFAFSSTSSDGEEEEEEEGVEELGDLVGKLKASIRSSGDEEYIGEAQNGDMYLDYRNKVFGEIARGEIREVCAFSSWCRFPVYEVDYGWGKPIWWCTAELPLKNLTVLVSTRCGQGIEAWVSMDDNTFQMLQKQIQLHFEC